MLLQVSIKTPFACVASVPLRPSDPSKAAAAAGSHPTNSSGGAKPQQKSAREVVTPGGYRIPEKLSIKAEGE